MMQQGQKRRCHREDVNQTHRCKLAAISLTNRRPQREPPCDKSLFMQGKGRALEHLHCMCIWHVVAVCAGSALYAEHPPFIRLCKLGLCGQRTACCASTSSSLFHSCTPMDVSISSALPAASPGVSCCGAAFAGVPHSHPIHVCCCGGCFTSAAADALALSSFHLACAMRLNSRMTASSSWPSSVSMVGSPLPCLPCCK